jgi:alanine dehydrogenase
VREADVVIGAVLVTGARAPHVVSADMVRSMEAGSVIVDISVDQGGCIETTRPTHWEAPTYQWEGVTHFCVTNMPGSVPRTSSQALSAAIAPYAARSPTATGATTRDGPGINVEGGKVTHPGVDELSQGYQADRINFSN